MIRSRHFLLLTRAFAAALRRMLVPALLALAGSVAHAQNSASWNTIGPAGGTVNTLLISPVATTTVYAATPTNGVFVSTDAGQTWMSASAGLDASDSARQRVTAVYALATDGQTLYAATGAGLYYADPTSTPTQWLALAGPPSAPKLTMLTYDAASQRLFAASNATDGVTAPQVYSTTVSPSGAPSAPTWNGTPLPVSDPTMTIGGLAIVPGQAGTDTLLVAVGNGVQAASILSTPDLVWVNADPGGTLAAASDTVNAITYSVDFSQAYACSGSTPYSTGNPLDAQPVWLAAAVAGTPASMACSAFFSVPIASGFQNLLLGTDLGAFTSPDGTSFAATAALPIGTAANGFALANPGSGMAELLMAGGFGVGAMPLSTLAAGAAWAARNGPASVAAGGTNLRLNNSEVSDTAVLGSTLYAVVATNAYRDVLASADGGATWSSTNIAAVLTAADAPTRLVADPARGVLYVATTQGLLAFTAATSQWTTVGAANIAAVSALGIGTTVVLAGTDNGLFAVPLSASPATAVPVAAGFAGVQVKAVLASGGTVYAGTLDDTSGLYSVASASETSVASGTATWAPFGTTPVGPNRITSLLLVDTTLLAATNGGLVQYATSNSPWASANVSSDPAQQISDAFGRVNTLFSDGVTIFAGTGNNGVFTTPFSGAFAWTPFNGSGTTALPSLEVRSLRASGDTLYAATRAGVAAFVGVTPGASPPPPPPPPSSGGGGGAMTGGFAALLALAVLLLARDRRRSRPV